MEISDLNAVIGLAAAPVLVLALTDHLKRAFRALGNYRRTVAAAGAPPASDGSVSAVLESTEASPWPLVADVVAVAWAFGLWASNMLPGGDSLRWPTVILLGVALGVGVGKARDRLTPERPQPDRVVMTPTNQGSGGEVVTRTTVPASPAGGAPPMVPAEPYSPSEGGSGATVDVRGG